MTKFIKLRYREISMAIILSTCLGLVYSINVRANNQIKESQRLLEYNRRLIESKRLIEAERNLIYNSLVSEVDSLIKSSAPNSKLTAKSLVDSSIKYDTDLVFILAQGHIESHFGTKGLAKRTNSVFNVGAYDNYKFNKVHSRFKYEHPDESIEPYLLNLHKRYLTNKTTDDLLLDFTNNLGHRYATSPSYENSLRKMYDSISENTRISELYSRYINFNKKFNVTMQ